MQADFTHRRDHEEARPARTFAAQQQQLGRNDRPEQNMKSVIAQQLDQFRKTKENSIRFQQVDNDHRQQFGRLRQEVQALRQQRQQLEAKAVDPTATPPVQGGRSARVKLPKSPFVAKRPDEFDENQRPPQTHAQPQLDPKLVPQPRRQRSPRAGTSPETPKVSVEPKAVPKVEPQPAPPRTNRRHLHKRQRRRRINRRYRHQRQRHRRQAARQTKGQTKDKPKGKP